ncbi:SRPBCC family protein [Brevundimonas sp. S30B]|uniref:SRPBCC family protein n=1 Tax=unclassified Brevundimonas TaxID=2622653 RepID=UPI001072852D|nr:MULTISPECIES: SRPBCC family protein [unclassified Brevundimonas]QBX36875.1 SRPBCC family protein [Brevundimonas sp. MF30-B]TFW04330.1 SRPBCC family protein [Brevundimonas sp. S30B]
MTDVMDRIDQGVWRAIDGGWELRFERRLRHSPDRVWGALTTPQGLRCWLAEGVIEPREGGRMDLNFRQPETPDFPDTRDCREQSNEVLVFDPPRRFDHTFGHEESIVSWRLAPDGDGTHLTLIHRVPQAWECDLSRTLSGWHHHMEGLEDAAQGRRHPWSWSRWTALRDAYAVEIAS